MKAEDFAKSLLIFMPYSKYNTYCQWIDKQLEKWGDKTISLNEYITFQYFLTDVEHIEEAVTEHRLIDTKMFKKIVTEFETNNKYCKLNPKTNCVSDIQIQVFFDTLDLNGSGKLEHDEIMGVLGARQ